MPDHVNVIGGGLAGVEAACRLAREGIAVRLFEMRPGNMTPAHRTGNLAELVCSNSLKSEIEDTAQGLLKNEMRFLGSLILECAELTRVPAGSALAVDRERFAQLITERIEAEPLIELVRQEVVELPEEGYTILATGPLTSDKLAEQIITKGGRDNLYFYDAIAPSVQLSSLDMNRIYKASRYDKGSADYYNCPMTEEEYADFYSALVEADTKMGRDFEQGAFFNACMPVEEVASRGVETLRFGTMRPVGLVDPHTGRIPYAVVQLRQEDIEGKIYGLVGFQTRMKWPEQQRVFRMIPGLENAEFVRYGAMHRNTFINSPGLLNPDLRMRDMPSYLVAGQLSGVEGYMESAATGILAGINTARLVQGQPTVVLPEETMIGALVHYVCTAPEGRFQPMNANFGLLPVLNFKIKNKRIRYMELANRSMQALCEMSELLQK